MWESLCSACFADQPTRCSLRFQQGCKTLAAPYGSGRKAEWSAAPRSHHKPVRSVLAPSAGLPSLMKRSMSMLCSLVHGGDNNSNKQPHQQQPQSVKAAAAAGAEDSNNAAEVPAVEEEEVVAPVVAEPAPPAPAPVPSSSGAKFGQAYIKVVGCGGGGGNAIARMIAAGLQVRECALRALQ